MFSSRSNLPLCHRSISPIILFAIAVSINAQAEDDKSKVSHETAVFENADEGLLVPGEEIVILNKPNKSAAGKSAIEDKAYILYLFKWDSPTIFVCWENPKPSDEHERLSVRQAIKDSWEKYSTLRFKGWTSCSDQFSGIRILIADAGPHTKGLGKALAGKKDGMVLNFSYENWNSPCMKQKAFCNTSIAVHEFGHALGFAHEHNRPDTPGECTQRAQGIDGDKILTSWDKASVMNYCNSEYNNNGKLSRLDIMGLQMVYGEPGQ
jgi:hypothetical protein